MKSAGGRLYQVIDSKASKKAHSSPASAAASKRSKAGARSLLNLAEVPSPSVTLSRTRAKSMSRSVHSLDIRSRGDSHTEESSRPLYLRDSLNQILISLGCGGAMRLVTISSPPIFRRKVRLRP